MHDGRGGPGVGRHRVSADPVTDQRMARGRPAGDAPVEEPLDRANGLPRSNYFTEAPVNDIQAMSQHRRDVILDHPAIKTDRRER